MLSLLLFPGLLLIMSGGLQASRFSGAVTARQKILVMLLLSNLNAWAICTCCVPFHESWGLGEFQCSSHRDSSVVDGRTLNISSLGDFSCTLSKNEGFVNVLFYPCTPDHIIHKFNIFNCQISEKA